MDEVPDSLSEKDGDRGPLGEAEAHPEVEGDPVADPPPPPPPRAEELGVLLGVPLGEEAREAVATAVPLTEGEAVVVDVFVAVGEAKRVLVPVMVVVMAMEGDMEVDSVPVADTVTVALCVAVTGMV